MPTKPPTDAAPVEPSLRLLDAAPVEPSLRLLDAAPVEPSLRLLDEIFDDAADAALDDAGPVDPRGTRLNVAMVLGMAPVVGVTLPFVSRAWRISSAAACPDDPDATDTARIVAMDRGPLTQLVMRLYAIRGEPPDAPARRAHRGRVARDGEGAATAGEARLIQRQGRWDSRPLG